MKKHAIIVVVAAIAFSTVLIAGCAVNVNNTASPSPTPSASVSPSASISVKTVDSHRFAVVNDRSESVLHQLYAN